MVTEDAEDLLQGVGCINGKLRLHGKNRGSLLDSDGNMPVSGRLRYVIGDATRPLGSGNRIVVHVCNDVGGWGRGFVLALSARWPEPEVAYLQWFAGRATNDFELGTVQLVAVSESIWVANLLGQRDIVVGPDGPPVRYDAIADGLRVLAVQADELLASIHMPRIGSGLAGGEWSVIETIVEETLVAAGLSVTVYDLP